MTLAKLDVFNVRNIESAELVPSPRLNFIIGPNGSGKTSLLEAIYILGRARSFRSTQASQVIHFQQDELTVSGKIGGSVELTPSPWQGEGKDGGWAHANPTEASIATTDSLPPPRTPPEIDIVEIDRHAGAELRYRDEAANARHPWSLDSGDPCRNDEKIFTSTTLHPERERVPYPFMENVWGGLPSIAAGVRLGKRKREIVLAGRRLQGSAELIQAFPVQLIQPSSSSLLEDAPKYRRQFLDWGSFHLDPLFLENWRGYARALNQRNALLRSGNTRGIEIWNHELSRYGTIVASARSLYADKLRPFFHEAAEYFLGSSEFVLRISPGWNIDKCLDEALRDDITLDTRDGYTHSGPHKGDFTVMSEGKPARNYLSRGQMKLLVYALLLAQAHLLEESLGARGCVLIDDLASELDSGNRRRLLAFLRERRAQFFITATDPGVAEGLQDAAVFHVEHGRIALL